MSQLEDIDNAISSFSSAMKERMIEKIPENIGFRRYTYEPDILDKLYIIVDYLDSYAFLDREDKEECLIDISNYCMILYDKLQMEGK